MPTRQKLGSQPRTDWVTDRRPALCPFEPLPKSREKTPRAGRETESIMRHRQTNNYYYRVHGIAFAKSNKQRRLFPTTASERREWAAARVKRWPGWAGRLTERTMQQCTAISTPANISWLSSFSSAMSTCMQADNRRKPNRGRGGVGREVRPRPRAPLSTTRHSRWWAE